MLIERQLSIFCAGISAALVVPECYPVYMEQAPVSAGPHVGLLIGTVLGAFGVLLGILLAAEHLEYADGWGERLWALSMLLAWALFAIGLSAATALVALHAPGLGWRIVLAVDSLAPLTGCAIRFYWTANPVLTGQSIRNRLDTESGFNWTVFSRFSSCRWVDGEVSSSPVL